MTLYYKPFPIQSQYCMAAEMKDIHTNFVWTVSARKPIYRVGHASIVPTLWELLCHIAMHIWVQEHRVLFRY